MSDNDISRWQEAIASLPDKQFFNTMRLYLGEIKTPYNKQRLTQQLAAFIKREENLSSLLTLLDSFDVTILTAISLIPNPSQQTLIEFFCTQYSVTDLYAEIINLTERLLIYIETDPDSEKEFIRINPLIRDNLLPYFDTKLIFPEYTVAQFTTDDAFEISPNTLAAFITYIRTRGISCKADGTIKKNDKARLKEIFSGNDDFIQLLMNAFVNLSLVYEDEEAKCYKMDLNRIKKFAELSEIQQYALLCAAAVSRFSKDGLKKEAQLLIDCLSSIPENGFCRESILRLAFLVGTYTEDGSALAKKSRFSRILEAARQEAEIIPEQNADLLDRMINCALVFGLIKEIGKSENEIKLYRSSDKFHNSGNGNSSLTNDSLLNGESETVKKVLNIDSTFTVTLMPGLQLKELLPLTDFMLAKKCEIVTEFEITKQSVSEGFDQDLIPETIFERIEKYCYYQVPQNLKINITEWYNSYSSAQLYYGYILKVKENNINFVENNPNIKKYIKEKLTEGIYLLNLPAGSDINEFINDSSLDFMGNIKSSQTRSEFTTFPLLRNGHKPAVLYSRNNNITKTSIVEADKILKELKSSLKNLDMEKHIKDSLKHRISSRLILSENQLKTASVRTEILEADGMDFSGKIHLIEAAVKDEDLMELQMPSADYDAAVRGDFFTIVGKPLSISRQPGEAVMRFQIEPTKDIQNFLVSRITHLRRLRY